MTDGPVFSINLTYLRIPANPNYQMSIKKSQAVLKFFIDPKRSVWFMLGSENETMFCDTWNFFSSFFLFPLFSFLFPLSSLPTCLGKIEATLLARKVSQNMVSFSEPSINQTLNLRSINRLRFAWLFLGTGHYLSPGGGGGGGEEGGGFGAKQSEI